MSAITELKSALLEVAVNSISTVCGSTVDLTLKLVSDQPSKEFSERRLQNKKVLRRHEQIEENLSKIR